MRHNQKPTSQVLFKNLEHRARKEQTSGFVELLLDTGRDSQERPIEAYWSESGQIGFQIPLSEQQSRNIKPDLRGKNITLRKFLKNGQACVAITLRNLQLRPVFEAFGDSVLDAIDSDPDNAGPNVVALHRQWKSLLAASATSSLGVEAEIGLLCELQTLESLLPDYGVEALSRWEGPTLKKHDFMLPDRSIECKATNKRDGLFVTVHGRTQLGTNSLPPTELHVRKYEQTPNGTLSLPLVVDSLLNDPEIAPYLLLEKLADAGYQHSYEQKNSANRYNLVEHHRFEIIEGFPCISFQDIPDRVQNIQYTIDLSSPESVPGYLGSYKI